MKHDTMKLYETYTMRVETHEPQLMLSGGRRRAHAITQGPVHAVDEVVLTRVVDEDLLEAINASHIESIFICQLNQAV